MIARQSVPSTLQFPDALREARQRTLELVVDLTDEQMMGPRLGIVNPLRWEIAHVAFFQEFWMLRHLRGHPPILKQGDSLYDSAKVAHDTRWDIPLLSRPVTLSYMQQVLDRVIEEHTANPSPSAKNGYDEDYFFHLSLLHECMHDEAFTYTRQTLGYPEPKIAIAAQATVRAGENAVQRAPLKLGDACVPGGTFMMGSAEGSGFNFDNEQWAHRVEVKPFSISKTAVSNEAFLGFVEDGGYQRPEFWSEEGWRWREQNNTEHPVYWERQSGGRWLRRNFDRWVALELRNPVLHVNWFESDAYCRWAGRRLPTEAEWEMAASCEATAEGSGITGHKRSYPWGDEPPTPERANLDWRVMACVPVDALPAGDSAFGCRQMIGNTWEWTSTDFAPYPGFEPGPYKEYSAPWFGDHKVLRGGCWVTRSFLIRNVYRNFYTPDRRDVWAGFRTCAR